MIRLRVLMSEGRGRKNEESGWMEWMKKESVVHVIVNC